MEYNFVYAEDEKAKITFVVAKDGNATVKNATT